MEKRLGKIINIWFGILDREIGVHYSLGSESSWGVTESYSIWDPELIKWDEHCKWSDEERHKKYTEIVMYISKLLKEAKVDSIDNLIGKPIEATFDGNRLISWRILTEVI